MLLCARLLAGGGDSLLEREFLSLVEGSMLFSRLSNPSKVSWRLKLDVFVKKGVLGSEAAKSPVIPGKSTLGALPPPPHSLPDK